MSSDPPSPHVGESVPDSHPSGRDGPSCPAGTKDDGPLSAWDAASLIIGIVIGASIFRVPADVMTFAGGGMFFALWILGGLLSLAGALCYCELATAYPRSGGDYEYLSRAWGRWMGFLFGWMRLTVILPANVGLMAFIFAEHAGYAWKSLFSVSPTAAAEAWVAAAVIVAVTINNLCGLEFGRRLQNVLTVAKVAGLAAIVVGGIAAYFFVDVPVATGDVGLDTGSSLDWGMVGVALVLVLYSYGGWNDAAFVAAEVRDRRRNIPRALLLGMGAITVLYLAVNAAYVAGLGVDGLSTSHAPAADLLQRSFGRAGGIGISVIVMLSTMGAINGMIFAGSRVFAVMGEDHRLFAGLGKWDRRRGTPARALLAIAGISLALVWLTGTKTGRGVMQWPLRGLGMTEDVTTGRDGFDTLLTGSSAIFWLFFLLVGVAVVRLRTVDGSVDRPFRVPLYPLTPIVFCGSCGYMLWSSADYAPGLSLIGLGLLVIGIGLYAVSRPRGEYPDRERNPVS